MGETPRDSGHPPAHRAPRYPIQISMLYRMPGNKLWRQAHTENISRSGVLFRTPHLMPLEAPIEMLLALPVEATGGQSARVVCRGRVVRIEGAADDATARAVAATITNYRLMHSQSIDPKRP
jgi:hypothetical protein